MVERIAIIYIESEVQTMRTEKKELNIQIGKRLQTVRENSGYTQEAFAEALDIGVEHYRKIEFGMYGLQRNAIPVAHDLPIFVGFEESLYSLDRINELSNVQYFCPAWDEIYDKISIKEVINDSKRMLHRLKDAVHKVEVEYKELNEDEKILMIFKKAGILQYAGNPLVVKSIEACRKSVF